MESPFQKPAKASKNSKQTFPLFSFLAIMTLGCVREFLSSWKNGIPLNKIFTLGGRLFNLPKCKHVLKRTESHCCEVNTLGIFACNFSTFSKVSQRN